MEVLFEGRNNELERQRLPIQQGLWRLRLGLNHSFCQLNKNINRQTDIHKNRFDFIFQKAGNQAKRVYWFKKAPFFMHFESLRLSP